MTFWLIIIFVTTLGVLNIVSNSILVLATIYSKWVLYRIYFRFFVNPIFSEENECSLRREWEKNRSRRKFLELNWNRTKIEIIFLNLFFLIFSTVKSNFLWDILFEIRILELRGFKDSKKLLFRNFKFNENEQV